MARSCRGIRQALPRADRAGRAGERRHPEQRADLEQGGASARQAPRKPGGDRKQGGAEDHHEQAERRDPQTLMPPASSASLSPTMIGKSVRATSARRELDGPADEAAHGWTGRQPIVRAPAIR
jgi:hypothetical protein